MFAEFIIITVRSLKLDKTLYKDNKNFDEAGIYFAVSIIIITSLIGIIPNNVLLDFASLYLGEIKPPRLGTVLLTSGFAWLLKSLYLFVVGLIMFPKKQIKNGNQIFWVCPLIEKSKILNHQSAIEKYKFLNNYFKNKVGIIHGSMNKNEKSDPDILNASRIKRIARGSGSSEHDVKELMKNYKNSKNMMKASKGRQMQGFLRKLGMG